MEYLDEMAKAAMQSLVHMEATASHLDPHRVAKASYEIADAMLRERERRDQEKASHAAGRAPKTT